MFGTFLAEVRHISWALEPPEQTGSRSQEESRLDGSQVILVVWGLDDLEDLFLVLNFYCER